MREAELEALFLLLMSIAAAIRGWLDGPKLAKPDPVYKPYVWMDSSESLERRVRW